MKTVAKGILKDHLVLVADSMMSTSINKRFNNAGYKATFHPLKGASTSYRVHLVYPYEMHEKTAERCHPNPLGCVVSSCSWGKHAVLGTESSFEILQRKSAKKQQGVW
jgi:DNA-directed RNA polymerase-5 subunit 1